MIKNVDVAIVGGGPAGMVSACLLSRVGVSTVVLEKNKDFSREFRGEILQPRFLQAIKDIDLYEHLKKCPHEEIDGAQIYFHSLKVGQVDAKRLDRRNPHIWWMTQPDLLNGYYEYAKQYENFEILFNASVRELHPGPRLVFGHNDSEVEVNAKIILASDGRFSAVKRLGGFETLYDHHDLDVVWFLLERPKNYTHYFSFFVGVDSAYLILPKHPNQLQCGMVLRPGQFIKLKSKGIEAFRKKLAQGHQLFVEYAKDVNDFSNFHLLKGNRSLIKDWVKNGVVLIGDAAHTCSPAGGIGVAIATETAIVACKTIIQGMKSGDLSDRYLRRIQRERIDQVKTVHLIQGQARLALAPAVLPLRLFIPFVFPIISFLKIIPLFAQRLLAQADSFGADYSDQLKVKDALELYFKRAGFGRETYTEAWIRLPFGPFNFYLPNIKPRRDVVPLHDVDHVVAEYSTNWAGEFEITAYELGMGLGKYWFGWVIDLQGIWLAVAIQPIKTLKSFARGRRTKCFYKEYKYDGALMEMKLGEIRRHIGVSAKDETPVQFSDVLSFLSRLGLSLLIHSPILIGMYLIFRLAITH